MFSLDGESYLAGRTESEPQDVPSQSDLEFEHSEDEASSEKSESDLNDNNNDLLYDDLEEQDQRFSNSSMYIETLEQLEQQVYNRSALKYWSSWQIDNGPNTELRRDSLMDFLEVTIPPSKAAEIVRLFDASGSDLFLQWAACRSVLLNARENIKLLENAGYCRKFFSIISLDPDRPEIARLRSISIANVDQLVSEFEIVFQKITQPENGQTSITSLLSDGHVDTCRLILDEVGLIPEETIPIESLWRQTVHLLDLGVISYAGAHIERIDEKYIGKEISEIPLFSQIAIIGTKLNGRGTIRVNQFEPAVINVLPTQSAFINIGHSTPGIMESRSSKSSLSSVKPHASGANSTFLGLKSNTRSSKADPNAKTYAEVKAGEKIHTELEPDKWYSLSVKPQMPVALEIKPDTSACIDITPNSNADAGEVHRGIFQIRIQSEKSLNIEIKPSRIEIVERGTRQFLSLQRRRLRCLNRFLGSQEIWAFGQPTTETGNKDTAVEANRLCLSTNIESLSDVWGPAWAVKESESQSQINSYHIGNGVIVPWSDASDHASISAPAESRKEVFCHWTSYRDENDVNRSEHQNLDARNYFLPEDVLVIGADNGLRVNEDCKASVGYMKDALRRKNALRIPRTSHPRRYIDGYTVQVNASGAGFGSIGGTITYKRRIGFSMKDALVERWRNGRRNLADLEIFAGLEISLCTMNARRRRLWQILSSRTMHDFLKANWFEWKNEACETAYYEALADIKQFRCRFRNLWSNVSYRANIGDAISVCLDALLDTGVDEDTRELAALWVRSNPEGGYDYEIDSGKAFDSDNGSGADLDMDTESTSNASRSNVQNYEEWIVSLFRDEHSWTGLLRDSPETLTFAIIGEICLYMKNTPVLGWERCCLAPRERLNGTVLCWTPGDPVLETSLLLNEAILSDSDEGLRRRDPRKSKRKRGEAGSIIKQCWETRHLKKNYNFSLGIQGSLTFKQRYEGHMIMKWKPAFSETFQALRDYDVNGRILGKQRTPHHQEYMMGEWGMQPIPVLVRSSRSNRSSKELKESDVIEHIDRMDIETKAAPGRVHR